MNEPTQNKQSHADQHLLNLLNRGIDGELSAAEQTELDALLAGSEHARELDQSLKRLADFLDELPQQEPPGYLHDAIVSQVRLPVNQHAQGQQSGRFSQWLAAPWMRTGLAMAAGVLLTVGIYQTGSENLSPEDASRMTGTVMKNPGGVLLDSTDFNTNSFKGKAVLRSNGDLLFVDVSLESDGLAVLKLGFTGPGLEYAGINGLQNPSDQVTMAEGLISVTSSGQQHYELLLRSNAGFENDRPGPLALTFFAGNVVVHEAELVSSQ